MLAVLGVEASGAWQSAKLRADNIPWFCVVGLRAATACCCRRDLTVLLPLPLPPLLQMTARTRGCP